MKKLIKKLKDQRGSALLLTLGILSLVLIMAMSFAFSARTTRQVAKINADQVKARLLAESGLERVLAAMSYNYDGDIYPPELDAAPSWPFQSASGIGVSQKYLASLGTDYQIKRSLLTDPPTSTEMALPIVNNFTSPAAIGFQRVDVDPGTAETIGRIAFLVLEEANKLDINQMLTLRNSNSTYTVNLPFIPNKTTNGNPFNDGMLASLSDNYSASDFLYDITLRDTTSEDTADESNTVRLGLSTQEIQINSLYRSNLPDGFPGFAGTKAPWFSYRHLWNVMWGPNVPVLPVSHACRYTFFSGEDIEAYWHQDSEDATAGTGERQRFDVTGTEWGGWGHSGALVGAQRLVTELGGSTVRSVFSDPVPVPDYSQAADDPATVGFGIPHLAGLGALREQVAANMIDFCDGDNLATYYPSTYGLDSTSSPEYFGNEAVAYFNEVVVKVVAYKTLQPDPMDPNRNYSLMVDLYPELLNIFPDVVPVGRIHIRLYGVAQISIAGGPYTDLDSFKPGTPLDFMWPLLSPDELSQGFYTPSSGTFQLDPPRTLPESTSVRYRFQVDRIVMISDSGTDGELYDTGFFDAAAVSVEINASAEADPTGYPACITWEAGDPRNNQWAASWTVRACDLGEDESYSTPPSCPTLGAVNQHFITESSAAVSPDVETYATMDFLSADTTFSTAFIPNRPFRSLWELGAIHRGEAFRTLDIAGVDADILDEVKIGPLKRTRGKFNINSRNDAALAKLFENIDITRHYENVTKDEKAVAGAILVSPSFSSTSSLSRANVAAELVAEAEAAANPVPLNDRQREALIGRTANLLTTRVDKYSVLVVGQALKDLSGAGITATNWDDVKKTVINPTEYDGGYYSILGTQRILAHIVRDAWRNEYKVVQMQLLED